MKVINIKIENIILISNELSSKQKEERNNRETILVENNIVGSEK